MQLLPNNKEIVSSILHLQTRPPRNNNSSLNLNIQVQRWQDEVFLMPKLIKFIMKKLNRNKDAHDIQAQGRQDQMIL